VPEGRAPVTEQQIAKVFRSLADEHASRRARNEADRSWKHVQLTRLARLQARAMPEGPRAWAWLAGAVALACVALVWGWVRPAPLEFALTGAVAKEGAIVAGREPALITFSDRTTVEVAPGAAVNVAIAGEHSARVRLSRGSLTAHVRPQRRSAWFFRAGSYDVEVIGTRFSLAYDPDSNSFSIDVTEGKVRVTGPDRFDRYVAAGQRVAVSPAPEVTARTEAPPPEAPESSSSAAEPSKLAARDGAAVPPRVSPRIPQAAAPADWDALVAEGRFEEVVRQAQSLGVAGLLESGSARQVQAFAQAARYSGHADLAILAWNAARQRFPAQRVGLQAAFFLGRAYEDRGKLDQALTWLNTYLAESPRGVYAAEASGRRLTLSQRRHGRDAARKAAREYLARFPDGSYAGTARALLAED
jgi:ferric-dicitrate binding protein FerR (iron transport regulator)